MRTPTIHKHHCNMLKDPELRELHDYYSVTYGVNRDFVLNDLRYFHTADETIPPDLLRDMLASLQSLAMLIKLLSKICKFLAQVFTYF